MGVVAAGLACLGQVDALREGLAPLAAATARAAELAIRSTGLAVAREGLVLSHPGGFACEVGLACTGLPMFALALAAVLAYPAPRRRRWLAAGLLLPLLAALNLGRIVHLFHAGVRSPEEFAFAHGVLWRAVPALVLAGGWLVWRARADAALRRASGSPAVGAAGLARDGP